MTTPRVSLKNMTEEEKKEHKRKQMRDYMRNRKLQDPDFLEKQRECNRKRMEKKRQDSEYREKHRLYCVEYNEKTKQLKNKMKQLLQENPEILKLS